LLLVKRVIFFFFSSSSSSSSFFLWNTAFAMAVLDLISHVCLLGGGGGVYQATHIVEVFHILQLVVIIMCTEVEF
jgi:hypothetical protein